MQLLGLSVERVNHDCFRIEKDGLIVYTDPYKVDRREEADLVFITHEHFDHCSPEDLARVAGRRTVLVVNANSMSKVASLEVAKLVVAIPGKEYSEKGVSFKAVPAYNVNKFRAPGLPFHPEQDEHCGYLIRIGGVTVYHAGDTDFIAEMEGLKCDLALLPVSGTYVMTAEEAAKAARLVKPKIAVPMHYGAIVGTVEDAERFKQLAEPEVQVVLL